MGQSLRARSSALGTRGDEPGLSLTQALDPLARYARELPVRVFARATPPNSEVSPGVVMLDSKFSVHSFRSVILSLACLMLLATTGCVFSDSSGSVSDSSGSFADSSGSISNSSESSSGDDVAYRGDIRDFTVAHIRSEGSLDGLRLGLSEVALTRGISDWEALPGTFVALGAGLAEAGVAVTDLASYQDRLARPGSTNHQAIGYGFATASN